jgi:AsmA family protein
MRKAIKISIFAGVIVMALTGLGTWYLTSAIDPAKLTALLSSSVKEATGGDLKISGPVSLHLFPGIGVRAEQVSLSNATWATHDPLLAVKRLELEVKLFPLLLGKVEVRRIVLDGVTAHLQTNRAGQNNWDLSSPTNTTNGSQNVTSNSAPTESTDNSMVTIESLQITNAKISYQNSSSSPKQMIVRKLSLDGDDGKTRVLLDAQYETYQLGLKGKVSAVRKVMDAWDQTPVNLDLDLNLSLNNKSLEIQGEIQKYPQKKPQFDIKLKSNSFDLAPLAASAAATASKDPVSSAKPTRSQGRYYFSNEPLPFDSIPSANGNIALKVAELGIPDQAPLKNVSAVIAFKGDRLDVQDLKFEIGRGQAHSHLSLSQLHSSNPSIVIKGMANHFTLEQALAGGESGSKVSGGEAQVALNLEGRGNSLHQFLSNANGAVQLSVGKARLDSQILNSAGDLAITIMNSLNPMNKSSKQTVLDCAVVYLPISNGVVNINDSVGAETDKLDIVLSGTVNLQSEAINLKINPHDKTGLTTGVDLGGLVQLEGTIQNPKAGVNKAGVVNSAVTIGLGILTSGISLAAENAKSLATKRQPCKTALHSWDAIYPGAK